MKEYKRRESYDEGNTICRGFNRVGKLCSGRVLRNSYGLIMGMLQRSNPEPGCPVGPVLRWNAPMTPYPAHPVWGDAPHTAASTSSLHSNCDNDDVAGASITSILGLRPAGEPAVPAWPSATRVPAAASASAFEFWQWCTSCWSCERDGCITYGMHKGICCVS